jgi:hypothetical protein
MFIFALESCSYIAFANLMGQGAKRIGLDTLVSPDGEEQVFRNKKAPLAQG